MGKITIPTQDNNPTKAVKTSVDAGKRVIEDKDVSRTETALEHQFEFTAEEAGLGDDVVRLIPIRKALGLDGVDISQDKKVNRILEWATSKGIDNKNNLLAELKAIDYKIGNPDGKSKLNKIYQYIIIDGQVRGLVNRQVAMEN